MSTTETLTLVRVNADALNGFTDTSDDGRTFFARSFLFGERVTEDACVVLVVPEHDTPERRRYDGTHLCGRFTVVEEDTSPTPEYEAAPVDPPTEEPFPVGSRWSHPNVERPFVVTGPPVNNYYPVAYDDGTVCEGSPFIAGALEISSRWPSLPNEVTEEPEIVPETFTRADLEEAERRGRDEEAQRHARWVESLADDAREWADSNSLCSEFDRFMEEHGMEGRERDYSVRFTVTLSVSASSEDGAVDSARELLDGGELDDWSVAVDYVERA